MRTAPKQIALLLLRYKKELESKNFPVEKMILFGSYAKGQAKEYSDIDVCIISGEFSKNKNRNEDLLWKSIVKIDPRIEPVAYTPSDFQKVDPLVYEIQQFGIEIK